MQTGITELDITVQVIQKFGARMEKLKQGWSGHLEKSIDILKITAARVGSQVVVSKMYGCEICQLFASKILILMGHSQTTTGEGGGDFTEKFGHNRTGGGRRLIS